MPHVILEHSHSANLPQLLTEFFKELHTKLAATGVVELARLKGRDIRHQSTVVGHSRMESFVFLQISLLSGRTVEQRKQLLTVAEEVLRRWCKQWRISKSCSVTIEVREMNYDTHQKLVLE